MSSDCHQVQTLWEAKLFSISLWVVRRWESPPQKNLLVQLLRIQGL